MLIYQTHKQESTSAEPLMRDSSSVNSSSLATLPGPCPLHTKEPSELKEKTVVRINIHQRTSQENIASSAGSSIWASFSYSGFPLAVHTVGEG